jgi:hypothetical protein
VTAFTEDTLEAGLLQGLQEIAASTFDEEKTLVEDSENMT